MKNFFQWFFPKKTLDDLTPKLTENSPLIPISTSKEGKRSSIQKTQSHKEKAIINSLSKEIEEANSKQCIIQNLKNSFINYAQTLPHEVVDYVIKKISLLNNPCQSCFNNSIIFIQLEKLTHHKILGKNNKRSSAFFHPSPTLLDSSQQLIVNAIIDSPEPDALCSLYLRLNRNHALTSELLNKLSSLPAMRVQKLEVLVCDLEKEERKAQKNMI